MCDRKYTLQKYNSLHGFTLIEISIVLVIIGLIVGGVLVGNDLIQASKVRATLSQIDKFNQAVNTFYGKFGYLPGDINAASAAKFGLAPRGNYAGQGDGNAILQGNSDNSSVGNWGWTQGSGETVMFWSDLSYANGMQLNLIDGNFSIASSSTVQSYTSTSISRVLPSAKLGSGNYFYVYSIASNVFVGTPVNYYSISAVTAINDNNGCGKCINSNLGLNVLQAYEIDNKIDDGKPTSGTVSAWYLDSGRFSGGAMGYATNSTSADASTCFDTTSGNYSITQNSGMGLNCALSFKVQGGN